jgi:hypothetical protein
MKIQKETQKGEIQKKSCFLSLTPKKVEKGRFQPHPFSRIYLEFKIKKQQAIRTRKFLSPNPVIILKNVIKIHDKYSACPNSYSLSTNGING